MIALLACLSCERIDNIDNIEVLQQPKQAQEDPAPDPDPEPDPEPEPEPTAVLTVSPASFEIAADGGVLTAEINSNCDWTVSNPATWCHLSTENGTGDYLLAMTVDENTSEESRTVTISISYGNEGKTVLFTITQKGKENPQRDPEGNDNTPPSW